MPRKVLFIVNPRAGKRNSQELISVIKRIFPKEIPFEIGLWRNIEEFNLLAKKLFSENFTDAVAVGGDGSVNLVGRTILNSNISLGIIPAGSGNGLARSLGYSMKTKKAVLQIAEGKTDKIDTGSVNDIPFFCTSGTGFDAHIGQLFANLKKRGFKTYVKIILREFSTYKAKTYSIIIDGKEIKREAFLITIANAGQYGNDFYIAPEASLKDGILQVVILKPFSLLQGIGLALKAFRKKAHLSRLVETLAGKEIRILREAEESVHYDGEPQHMKAELIYKIYPSSLNVVVGKEIS
jgi:diacylglycerol kinase (ATP)